MVVIRTLKVVPTSVTISVMPYPFAIFILLLKRYVYAFSENSFGQKP